MLLGITYVEIIDLRAHRYKIKRNDVHDISAGALVLKRPERTEELDFDAELLEIL